MSDTTLTRRLRYVALWAGVAAVAVACGNKTARAPVPTAYEWPDSAAYRMTLVARAERDTQTVSSFVETETLRFRVRYDGSYSVWRDSVMKSGSASTSEPADAVPLEPGDTLHYIVRLSRWGEFLSVVPACDPALPPCHDVAPSALELELRDFIPRLPVWWPPRGHSWEDTLRFDDRPRRWGDYGSVASVYQATRDTAAGGEEYWVVAWRSVTRAVDYGPGGAAAEAPVAEAGTVYVDKRLMIPAYAEWRSTVPAPAAIRLRGATRTDISGRAVLVGSVFDSPPFTREAR